jgi:hypothetical protein
MPSVQTVFAYEIIFKRSVRDLFAGIYEEVRRDIRARAKRLLKKVPEAEAARTSRKLELLRFIVDQKVTSADQS